MTSDSPTRGRPYLRPFVGIVLLVAVLTEVALALLPRQLVDTFLGRLVTIWPIVFVAAVAGSIYLARESRRTATRDRQRIDALETVDYLKAVNALLRTLASSPDITRSLFELAVRIHAIVPCDRVGLALLTEDRQGYITYTARIDMQGPEPHPRPDLHFPRGSTIIDQVVAAREGRVVDNITELAPSYLDVNVIRTAGFTSFVLVPLMFEGEALGTLNLVSRRPGAFSEADLHTLRPVAEALALAHGTRRMANALVRHQMANELSELTFAFANDMNGAVQAILGQCELLAREQHGSGIQQELAGMLQQARRLRDILDQMQRMTREHVATTTRPQ
ncbi:MAG TPA: GAF domain-containing protein [Vicinamibacterales bacterium]|nr:GAF domain-containing protein [Vicinamibacterales bacterium]